MPKEPMDGLRRRIAVSTGIAQENPAAATAEDLSRAQTRRSGPYDQRVIAFGHLSPDF